MSQQLPSSSFDISQCSECAIAGEKNEKENPKSNHNQGMSSSSGRNNSSSNIVNEGGEEMCKINLKPGIEQWEEERKGEERNKGRIFSDDPSALASQPSSWSLTFFPYKY